MASVGNRLISGVVPGRLCNLRPTTTAIGGAAVHRAKELRHERDATERAGSRSYASPAAACAGSASPFRRERCGVPPAAYWLSEATHVVATANILLPPPSASTNDQSSEVPPLLGRVLELLARGHRVELALPAEPAISTDHPASLEVAAKLAPFQTSGHFKLWCLPDGFDPRAWPRWIVQPRKADGRSLFSDSLAETCFLQTPLPVPIWRGPPLSEEQEKEFRTGWTPRTSLEQAAARIDASLFYRIDATRRIRDVR